MPESGSFTVVVRFQTNFPVYFSSLRIREIVETFQPALEAHLGRHALVVHVLRDAGHGLPVDEVAVDALDDARLLWDDDELESVGAKAALLVVLRLAVGHAAVAVAARPDDESAEHLPHLPAVRLLLQIGEIELVDDAAKLVRDLRLPRRVRAGPQRRTSRAPFRIWTNRKEGAKEKELRQIYAPSLRNGQATPVRRRPAAQRALPCRMPMRGSRSGKVDRDRLDRDRRKTTDDRRARRGRALSNCRDVRYDSV
ncbi:MAG TPA: hypothetical protein VM580_03940 [Labilithrix sp.]|nr:hypothetical protein [Labilithrix sp.]